MQTDAEKIKIERLKNLYLRHLNVDVGRFVGVSEIIEILNADRGTLTTQVLLTRHQKFRAIYDFYLSELILKLKKTKENKIEKILVFESPPKSGEHFLTHGGNYYTCFLKNDHLPLNYEQRERLINFIYNNQSLNNFIYNGDLSNDGIIFLNRLQNVLNSNIIYVDLFLLPANFQDARKKWKSDSNFKDYDGKRLTVYIFEWAIENLKRRLKKDKIDYPFSPNCKIVFGTPINTSISIFEYYRNNLFVLDTDVKIDLTIQNSPSRFIIQDLEGTTFPMFKYNIVNYGGSPSKELIKNAFNL
jgi:hypothetical protein